MFLYQEQVLRVAHELAGFSLAESDLLRRAMSHFDPGKRMQMLKEKFIAEAGKLKRVPSWISRADLGHDGCLCRLWLPKSAFGVLCIDCMAVGMVQDPLPR